MTQTFRAPTPLTAPRATRFTRLATHRATGVALKLLVSVTLIVAVGRHVGSFAITHQAAGQAIGWLALAGLLTLTQIALGALRWDQILQALGAALPIGRILRVYYVSSFFTCWLLGTVGGDLARAILLPAHARGRSVTVHAVLFDRVLTLGGLGLLALPGVLVNAAPFARGAPLLLSLAAAALPMVGMTAIAWSAPVLPGRPAILQHLVRLAASWRDLLRAHGRFAAALAIAALGQLALAAVAYCLARAQHIDVPLAAFVLLLPPVVLLTSLPISAGGWGVRETAMVAMLAWVGISPSAALLISVEMGAIAALVSLPGGVVWGLRFARRAMPLPALSR